MGVGRMKPTEQHIYLTYWPSSPKDGLICGIEQNYEYVSDEEYRKLPKCPICFKEKENIYEYKSDGEEDVKILTDPPLDLEQPRRLVLGRYL